MFEETSKQEWMILKHSSFFFIYSSFDWGVWQEAKNEETRYAIAQTLEYLHKVVYADDTFEIVRDRCKNLDQQCARWASEGDKCDGKEAEWMAEKCAPSCQNCLDLDIRIRCPWDPDQPRALYEGDLDKMFERIVSDPEFARYKPTVLSRPFDDNEEEDGPWVVTLDDFISEEECDHLIEAGNIQGYERSTAQAAETSDVGEYISEVTAHRTSYTAWCMDECYEDPIVETVTERMENLTGIDEEHYEYFQLLKYNEEQYYMVHHDYIELHQIRPMGPRILTIYLYLNEPEEGGGTRFPDLDLTVMPKRGRALIWPSVLNEDPMEKDWRTEHEALPVTKGQKYGANAWLHLGDFKDAFDRDCSV